MREKLAHLAIKLGRERLVGGQYHGRALLRLDQIGDGEGLARTGHAEQGLGGQAVLQPFIQRVDRRGLIAGQPVIGYQ